MIEIALQYDGVGNGFYPHSVEDREASREFKDNQIVRAKIQGVKKERSYRQLNTYWACCGFVAEQLSDHTKIWTKNDVDFTVKIRVAKENPAMIKRFKSVDGIVYMEPISISIPNLPHISACKYFDRAFPIMGEMVSIDAEKLIRETQARMK